eukprot:TRINITY_DN13498_c0_g1_i1.p2 TRINITY_DN13498_c0_g1~~TRINITY_DN13498_c0_g1_i1.p2  ORF type:complete len:132 (-),score=31.60 TRINITY_DN13498_c0_g1_i1:180-575(-)
MSFFEAALQLRAPQGAALGDLDILGSHVFGDPEHNDQGDADENTGDADKKTGDADEKTGAADGKTGGADKKKTKDMCTICHDEFHEGELVRNIPYKHLFHYRCLTYGPSRIMHAQTVVMTFVNTRSEKERT